MRYYSPNGPYMHDAWWFFGGLIPLLLFMIVVGLAIWAVLRLSHRPPVGPTMTGPIPFAGRADPSLEVVRSRYARGEITREEFLQLSSDLGGPVASPPVPPSANPPA